jgi:hypothetical protein
MKYILYDTSTASVEKELQCMKELAYRCSVRVEDSSEIPSRVTAIAADGQNANSPFSPPLSFSTEPDVRNTKSKSFSPSQPTL